MYSRNILVLVELQIVRDLTNRILSEGIIKTDDNLLVALASKVDDLPFCGNQKQLV